MEGSGLNLEDWQVPFFCDGCGLDTRPHYRDATFDDLVDMLKRQGAEVRMSVEGRPGTWLVLKVDE